MPATPPLDRSTLRPQSSNTVAFFGDSIVGYDEGFPKYAGLYSTRLITISDWVKSNSGYTSTQLAAVTSQITSLSPRPNWVVCLFGANDAQGQVAATTFASSAASIINTFQRAGINVCMCEVTPLGGSTYRPYVRQYNAWIRQYCSTRGIPVVPLYAGLVDATTGAPASGMISGDNVHPTALGQKTMGSLVASTLGPLLPPGGVAIAQDAGDTTNLVGSPYFLTNSNGVPTGWSASGSATGWTHSIQAADADSPLSWCRMVGSGASQQRSIASANITTGFSAGDVMLASVRVRSSGQSGSYPSLYAQVQRRDSGGTLLGYLPYVANGTTQTVPAGVAWTKFTVEESTNRMVFYMQAGPGDGTYDFSAPTLINLTSLGLT